MAAAVEAMELETVESSTPAAGQLEVDSTGVDTPDASVEVSTSSGPIDYRSPTPEVLQAIKRLIANLGDEDGQLHEDDVNKVDALIIKSGCRYNELYIAAKGIADVRSAIQACGLRYPIYGDTFT